MAMKVEHSVIRKVTMVLITPQLSRASSMVDSWKTSLLVSTKVHRRLYRGRSDFMIAISVTTIFMFTGHPFSLHLHMNSTFNIEFIMNASTSLVLCRTKLLLKKCRICLYKQAWPTLLDHY
jgi:hypothetical protein